ncbi:hypothetical protein PVAG01_01904 [Phlyctema vagabunda]|uniref:Uncharacterized protein n=1 Tax=Phlyctema vagabunda TaxID=108571 RepID=A0ABR4PYE4_9HELO
MLWLLIFSLWAFRTVTYGHQAGRPAARIMLFLLAILGILQVIVSSIDLIESPAATAPTRPGARTCTEAIAPALLVFVAEAAVVLVEEAELVLVDVLTLELLVTDTEPFDNVVDDSAPGSETLSDVVVRTVPIIKVTEGDEESSPLPVDDADSETGAEEEASSVVLDPVIIAEEGAVVEAAATDVKGAVLAAAPLKPGRKLGEYVAVPAYCGQPGTVVLGGARPPPQSRGSQTSPLEGTYQITLAPAGELTSDVVHPVRSVFADASAAAVMMRNTERCMS